MKVFQGERYVTNRGLGISIVFEFRILMDAVPQAAEIQAQTRKAERCELPGDLHIQSPWSDPIVRSRIEDDDPGQGGIGGAWLGHDAEKIWGGVEAMEALSQRKRASADGRIGDQIYGR